MSEGNGDDPRSLLRSERNKLANPGVPDFAPSDIDTARALLRPGIPIWCEKTLEGIKAGERTAMNNYARAMNLIGADVELNVNLILTRELGVGLSEARRLMAMVQSVDGIGYEDAMTSAEVALREFYRERGKRLVIVDEVAEVGA